MTVLHSGTTKRYSDNWGSIFDGSKKGKATAVAKKSRAKASTKKKAAKKSARKG